MEDTNKFYKYDAFISYRHLEPDQTIAFNIHKKLEEFKLPEGVEAVLPNGNKRIERIFRDEEELPLVTDLSEGITEALKNSEYLIVICSPRIHESSWCLSEIREFIKLKGRDRIIAVLVEGTPEESFPDELKWREVETVNEDGETIKYREKIESLAADYRVNNKKELARANSTQLLKIVAQMYSIPYDSLKRRHYEKQKRKKFWFHFTVTVALLIFFTYTSIFMSLVIHKDRELVKKTNELSIYEAEKMVRDGSTLLEYGDIDSALRILYKSLHKYKELNIPFSAGLENAMTKVLHVYDDLDLLYADDKIKTLNNVEDVVVSPDAQHILIFAQNDAPNSDARQKNLLYLYSEKKMRIEQSFFVADELPNIMKAFFLDNNRFCYVPLMDSDGKVNEGRELAIYDIDKDETLTIKLNDDVQQIDDQNNNEGKIVDLYYNDKAEKIYAVYSNSKQKIGYAITGKKDAELMNNDYEIQEKKLPINMENTLVRYNGEMFFCAFAPDDKERNKVDSKQDILDLKDEKEKQKCCNQINDLVDNDSAGILISDKAGTVVLPVENVDQIVNARIFAKNGETFSYLFVTNKDSGSKISIMKINLTNKKIEWVTETELDSIDSYEIIKYVDGKDCLLIRNKRRIEIYDCDDNQESERKILSRDYGEDILATVEYLNNKIYAVTSTGYAYEVNDDVNSSDSCRLIDMKSLVLKKIKPIKLGNSICLVGIEQNSNDVYFFESNTGVYEKMKKEYSLLDKQIYDEQNERSKTQFYLVNSQMEEKEKEILKENNVSIDDYEKEMSFAINEELKLLVVNMSNKTLDIYFDGEYKSSIKEVYCNGIVEITGPDYYGNYYLNSDNGKTLRLNQDFMLVAEIDDFVTLSDDKKSMIVDSALRGYCEIPVFTREELVQLLEKYVEEYYLIE